MARWHVMVDYKKTLIYDVTFSFFPYYNSRKSSKFANKKQITTGGGQIVPLLKEIIMNQIIN